MSEEKEFLRYGEVQTALEKRGIRRQESRKLMALGVIVGRPLWKHGARRFKHQLRAGMATPRNYYRWSQIERDVLSEAQGRNGK